MTAMAFLNKGLKEKQSTPFVNNKVHHLSTTFITKYTIYQQQWTLITKDCRLSGLQSMTSMFLQNLRNMFFSSYRLVMWLLKRHIVFFLPFTETFFKSTQLNPWNSPETYIFGVCSKLDSMNESRNRTMCC